MAGTLDTLHRTLNRPSVWMVRIWLELLSPLDLITASGVTPNRVAVPSEFSKDRRSQERIGADPERSTAPGTSSDRLIEPVLHGRYPNTFYRVSIKALIRNDEGEVLVVKEHQDKWELPGGGLDHGETIHDCLSRELREELGIASEFTESFNTVVTQYMASRPDKALDFWKMSMYFDVTITGELTIKPTAEITDFQFRPVEVLTELYG